MPSLRGRSRGRRFRRGASWPGWRRAITDQAVVALAGQAGLSVDWIDAAGQPKTVSVEVLRGLLEAMGLHCGSEADARDSREHLARDQAAAARGFATARLGELVRVPVEKEGGWAQLRLESGGFVDLRYAYDAVLPPIQEPGYHRLEIEGREVTVALAPQRSYGVRDASPDRNIWGLAVQVYSLQGQGAFGHFGDLARAVRTAAGRGAQALAISPVHALFAADPKRYSPYAPSTRLFLNGLYADPEVLFTEHPALDPPKPAAGGLVDWEAAIPTAYARLRRLFNAFVADGADGGRGDFETFRREGGERLDEHARFEALHGRFFAELGSGGWQGWPEEFHDPSGRAVAQFARENAREVEFHAFVQWLAARSLSAAQDAAKQAGMSVGLIADLAVGMDGGGSHAWSRPHDILRGINVGAPPDLFQAKGQSWGLSAFSPLALRQSGFEPFLATLRAALGHAGGVRIDHAMGLQRLWIVPNGATADQGAYLQYPVGDMLNLVRLESWRRKGVVVGEDLGTVPEGFREKLDEAGVLGMRVLSFERGEGGSFTPPDKWSVEAAALTSTHDLPTIAGWWTENDIDWAARIKGEAPAEGEPERRAERARDRGRLWEACVQAGAARGEPPAPDDPAPAVDGALRFVAETPCRLAIVPVEDVLGLVEQPNLPGTIDEHPNWRRRLPADLETLLAAPAVSARCQTLTRRGDPA